LHCQFQEIADLTLNFKMTTVLPSPLLDSKGNSPMFKHLLLSMLAVTTLTSSLKAQTQTTPMQNGIKHVVVLMLENRSYDNVLAWLYDDAKNAPNHFIPAGTEPVYRGLTEATLPFYTNSVVDSAGLVVFSSPPIKGIPSVADWPYLNSPQFDPYESYEHVVKQIYGDIKNPEPTMTGFLQNYASCWWDGSWKKEQKNICAVMETYTEKELPILYGLAKHYAVSDDWFSSVPTCTNPNRAYAACGTSDGQVYNGLLNSTFTSDTIWNKLTDLSPSTSWNIFWQSNVLPGVISGAFTGPNTFTAMNKIPDVHSHIKNMAHFHELARDGELPAFSFIEPELSEVMFEISGIPFPGLENYRIMAGIQGNDMHPPGDVRCAENLVANIYTSLIANEQAWQETLFVLTFDEHGGLFDHVVPPTAQAPDSNFTEGFMFDRYGVRVPAIFISPLIEKSTVVRSNIANVPFDHTSLISTILQWQNIDKSLWNMGKRCEKAPAFDTVITRTEVRQDSAIVPKRFTNTRVRQLRQKTRNDTLGVNIGDTFYLKDKDGNYVTNGSFFFSEGAFAGSSDDKVMLSFSGGSGPISHGSFAFIAAPNASNPNTVLESSLLNADCIFCNRSFSSGQWWTIKNADRPFLGAQVQFGERIYLENHIFLDIFEFIPARLTKSDSFFSNILTCKSITDEKSDDYYWVIEKAVQK
jgi:phospholipase C